MLCLFLLILFNAGLIACEFSLIKLRYSHFNSDLLDRLEEDETLSGYLTHSEKHLEELRLAMFLGVLTFGYMAIPRLEGLGIFLWGESFLPLWFFKLLAFVVALLMHSVLSDFMGRWLAFSRPVRVLKSCHWFIRVVHILLWPLHYVFRRIESSFLSRLQFGGGSLFANLDLEEQLKELERSNHSDRDLSTIGEHILKNAIQMRELVVSDVLLPRHKVLFFDVYDSLKENLALARDTGHTRFPLCEGDLDKCIGLVHIKDLFRYKGDLNSMDLRRVKRDILSISPDESLEEALKKLLHGKMHMALVVDEFQGTEGVLTLERILEQLVGEIQDEFDVEEQNIRQLPNNEYLVLGLTPSHDVEVQFDVEFENQEVSTFGGLITAELGRIPESGERLTIQGYDILITEVDDTRVIAARMRPIRE